LKAATGMKKAEQPSNTPQLTEIEQHVANILSNINFNMAGRKTSELSLAQQYFMQRRATYRSHSCATPSEPTLQSTTVSNNRFRRIRTPKCDRRFLILRRCVCQIDAILRFLIPLLLLAVRNATRRY
jgi:hypothetical protein